MNPKLTAERLERGAIVYIRQSTPGQVLHHREGRRQYALEDHARQLGFQWVAVIDSAEVSTRATQPPPAGPRLARAPGRQGPATDSSSDRTAVERRQRTYRGERRNP
jgi:hypothetical protein